MGLSISHPTSNGAAKEKEKLDFLPNLFVPNGNSQNWFQADRSCQNQNGSLISLTESSTFAKIQIFIQTLKPEEKIGGFWTYSAPSDASGFVCRVISNLFKVVDVNCSDSHDDHGAIFVGLCQRNKQNGEELRKSKQTEKNLASADHQNKNNKQNEDHRLAPVADFFTCQCKTGFGNETCEVWTNDEDGQGQRTTCITDPNVKIKSGSDALPLIYIDHAAYGRILKPQDEVPACHDYYVSDLDEVSVICTSLNKNFSRLVIIKNVIFGNKTVKWQFLKFKFCQN